MGCDISLNVRCLLWRKGVPRGGWAHKLSSETGITLPRVNSLLSGDLDETTLLKEEVTRLAEVTGLGDEADNLRHEGYALVGCDVLRENLRYLLNSLGRGGKKALAGELGVDPTTLSRWLNGSFVPQTSTLRQLVSHFGLPLDTDLETEPIFLSAQPISAAERRDWLRGRIEDLESKELRELFPALRRLLEKR